MTDNVITLRPSVKPEFMQYRCDNCGSRSFKILIETKTEKTHIECNNCSTAMDLAIVETDDGS